MKPIKIPLPTSVPSKLKKKEFNSEDYVSNKFTSGDVKEIKAAFDLMDEHQCGLVDPAELYSAFMSLGLGDFNPVIAKMLAEIKDKKEPMDFDFFINITEGNLIQTKTKEDIEKLFALFDEENNGEISAQNIGAFAANLGQMMSEDELEKIVEKADVSKRGFLSFEDFYAVMTSSNE